MTEPINSVHREGDWIVAVNYGLDFDTIDVHIGRRADGGVQYLLPNGFVRYVPNGERMPDEPSMRINRECRVALAHALLGTEPADQQLIDSLQSTLNKESSRVDKLLEHLIRETA